MPDPTNPQSFNRYTYVLNSPPNYTDPTGHMHTDGCEWSGCSTDGDNWGQNYVAYMAQGSDRTTQATYGMYLDYYNQFANIIEVSPELVEYTLWQMAAADTAALQQKLDSGGWLGNAIADAFGGGYIDAFDVIEGSLGLTLATAQHGNDGQDLPGAYSVAFETQLPAGSFPGRPRAHHNQQANRALVDTMNSSPEFATAMNELIPDVQSQLVGSQGGISRQAPKGWTWHHHAQTGVMQLVPTSQHASPAYRHLFHPSGRGGYSIWGD